MADPQGSSHDAGLCDLVQPKLSIIYVIEITVRFWHTDKAHDV